MAHATLTTPPPGDAHLAQRILCDVGLDYVQAYAPEHPYEDAAAAALVHCLEVIHDNAQKDRALWDQAIREVPSVLRLSMRGASFMYTWRGLRQAYLDLAAILRGAMPGAVPEGAAERVTVVRAVRTERFFREGDAPGVDTVYGALRTFAQARPWLQKARLRTLKRVLVARGRMLPHREVTDEIGGVLADMGVAVTLPSPMAPEVLIFALNLLVSAGRDVREKLFGVAMDEKVY